MRFMMTRFKIFSLLFACISFLNLFGQNTQDTIHYFNELFPKSGLFIRPDSLPDGVWIAFCETNTTQIGLKLHYKNGERNGESISFWPDGNIQQKGFYKNGCAVGLDEKWYENGVKEWECNCVCEDSIIDSPNCHKINYWTKDGKQLIKDGTGDYISYHDNGVLQVTGAYLNGERTGRWTWYYNDGALQTTENYVNGKQDGEYHFYFRSGQIRSKGMYSNGKQVGKWEDWYNNGKYRQVENRVNGKMDGEADYWYENGQLYASGNYKLSEYDGIWKYWNEEGKIEKEEFYENGKLKKTKEYH
jgi:uncharacterized protein